MAAVQTPADKLLRILTGNRPAPCDLIGTSTTSMKLLGPEAMDVALHPRDYIRADTGNHLYNRLQRDIDSALPFLVFPEQAPDPASGRPGLTWIALENYISQQSILALTENDPYGGEGEAGLLAFLKTYLFDPLNYLIRVTLPHLPGHLKWYTAGVNKAKPDMRLKWIPDHGTDQDVAAVEFKTPFSCPDRIMKDFMEAIKAGNVRVDPDGQSRNGDTHDKGCQILDQIRAVTRVHGTYFISITNGTLWWPGYAEKRRAGQSDRNPMTFTFSELREFTAAPKQSNWTSSLLGLLFGISLSALKDEGVSIADYSSRGQAPSALIPPRAVRPSTSAQRHVDILHSGSPLDLAFTWSARNIRFYPSKDSSDVGQNYGLYLNHKRGSGATYETYNIQMATELPEDDFPKDPASTDLVAKVHIPFFEPTVEEAAETKRAFDHEMVLYDGPLKDLQGSVVPRVYGGWKTGRGSYLIVLDDAGQPPTKEQRQNEIFLTQVREAFMAIVRAGVLHDDLEWWHVLCRNDEVRIIDFDRTTQYDATRWTSEEWEAMGQRLVDRLFEYSYYVDRRVG